MKFYGIRGGAELIDLDGDKKPEIIVRFTAFRGNESGWIFRWTGTALKLISPTEPDGSTQLGSFQVMDLSGDGKLSIVTQQPLRPTRDENGNIITIPTPMYTLSRLNLMFSRL